MQMSLSVCFYHYHYNYSNYYATSTTIIHGAGKAAHLLNSSHVDCSLVYPFARRQPSPTTRIPLQTKGEMFSELCQLTYLGWYIFSIKVELLTI